MKKKMFFGTGPCPQKQCWGNVEHSFSKEGKSFKIFSNKDLVLRFHLNGQHPKVRPGPDPIKKY